ncbi:MAG: hypothetical protein ACI80H_001128 [Pseudoalteromonas distincta]|jgi:hypothetical protein
MVNTSLCSTFGTMKNTIYTLILLLLPTLGWTQFQNLSKLSFTDEESTDALRYNVYGCTSEIKVVLTRHSTDGGVLVVNFKDYDDESLEKMEFSIGNNYLYKVVPLEKHLLIFIGGNHPFLLKSNWTKTIVIPYSDLTAREFGEDVSETGGTYKALDDINFMKSFEHANYDYKECTNTIALRYGRHLHILNLIKESSKKVDLKIGSSKSEYDVLKIIPSKNSDDIHIFTKSPDDKNVILKLSENGDILKTTTINDENLGKTMYFGSFGYYENDGDYFFCGVSKKSTGGADGLRTYSIVNDKLSVKSYGFTDKKIRSLEENVKGVRVRTNEGGSCRVFMSNGKTYVVVKYLKSFSTGNGQQYEVVTNINALEIEDNKITGSIVLSAENIEGRVFDDYTLIYDEGRNQITGINSTKAGVTQVVFDFDSETGKSFNLFDGLTWSHNIISDSKIFIYGLFKDGKPYQMQMSKKKDKGCYYATGILRF